MIFFHDFQKGRGGGEKNLIPCWKAPLLQENDLLPA